MKLFILGLLLMTINAQAGECKIDVYTLNCSHFMGADYGCMRNFPWIQTTEKINVEESLENCLSKAVSVKNEYLSNGSEEAEKRHEKTTIFDKIKVHYKGPEGTITAKVTR